MDIIIVSPIVSLVTFLDAIKRYFPPYFSSQFRLFGYSFAAEESRSGPGRYLGESHESRKIKNSFRGGDACGWPNVGHSSLFIFYVWKNFIALFLRPPSLPPLADKATPLHSTPKEFIAFHFQFSSLTIRLSFFSRPPLPLSREMKLTPTRPYPKARSECLIYPLLNFSTDIIPLRVTRTP